MLEVALWIYMLILLIALIAICAVAFSCALDTWSQWKEKRGRRR